MKGLMERMLNDLVRWESYWDEKASECESPISTFLVGVLHGIIEVTVLSATLTGITGIVQEISKRITKK